MSKKLGVEVEKSRRQSIRFISPVNTGALSHSNPHFRRVWQCSVFRADAGYLSNYGCRDQGHDKVDSQKYYTACTALYSRNGSEFMLTAKYLRLKNTEHIILYSSLNLNLLFENG